MGVVVQIKQKSFEEAVARANITYIDLAKELGINRIYLANIKNEKFPDFRPSGKLRERIIKVFTEKGVNVTFDSLFKVMKK